MPLVKLLVVNDRENYKVTGVIKAIPQQSHFNFDMFVSMSNSEESRQNSWLRPQLCHLHRVEKRCGPPKARVATGCFC
jgi:hypothetical protein